eukprot:6396328-Ditylum_brightwellii.AAC.1
MVVASAKILGMDGDKSLRGNELPEGAHIQQVLSDTDQKFIGPEKADQLAIYVDIVYATDIKHRQSMGG